MVTGLSKPSQPIQGKASVITTLKIQNTVSAHLKRTHILPFGFSSPAVIDQLNINKCIKFGTNIAYQRNVCLRRWPNVKTTVNERLVFAKFVGGYFYWFLKIYDDKIDNKQYF